MPNRLTPLDFNTAAIHLDTGTFTPRWMSLLRLLFGDVASVSGLPAIINRNTLANLNALGLGAGDAGYLAFEYTYGQLLRWTGTVWEFAPGSGNKFRRDFLGAPQEVGWALMDGSATDYLTVGAATLTVTPVTLPNLTGSPAFHKSIAAYTGTIEAAIAAGLSGAPSISGSTGNAGAGVSGNTGNSSPGTSPPNGGSSEVDFNNDGITKTVAANNHDHDVDAHLHDAGTLSVDSHNHSSGTLAVGLGTLATNTAARPPSIGWLPYFKR